MFPINLKWVDDAYDKLESACAHVDDIISEEKDSLLKGLRNVGTNVNQFFSTVNPMKYVGDQLEAVGTKVELSMDTVLSTFDDIFPGEDHCSSAWEKKSEPRNHVENVGSISHSVASAEMVEEVVSSGKFEKSNLNPDDIITQTDQSCVGEGHSAGLYSTAEVPEVELEETLIPSLAEKTDADAKVIQSPKTLQLDKSCIVINEDDWFTYQVTVDDEAPKIKRPSPSTSRSRQKQCGHQSKSKNELRIIKEPCVCVEKEQLCALPMSSSSSNHDSWESEWEIV